MTPWLSDPEIAELCEPLEQAAAQIRHLKRQGFHVTTKPNGRPLLMRSEYARVQALHAPPPPPDASEAPPPSPVPWSETPLGRLQAAARAARAAEPAPARPPRLTAAERRAIADHRAELRRGLVRHHAAKRRAARLCRTPAWADQHAILAIYAEARRLTVETGIPHHVDHEYPLQGELVSGLHVETNLQILTGTENSRKKNRFEVEP